MFSLTNYSPELAMISKPLVKQLQEHKKNALSTAKVVTAGLSSACLFVLVAESSTRAHYGPPNSKLLHGKLLNDAPNPCALTTEGKEILYFLINLPLIALFAFYIADIVSFMLPLRTPITHPRFERSRPAVYILFYFVQICIAITLLVWWSVTLKSHCPSSVSEFLQVEFILYLLVMLCNLVVDGFIVSYIQSVEPEEVATELFRCDHVLYLKASKIHYLVHGGLRMQELPEDWFTQAPKTAMFVSHAWETPEMPDPTGRTVRAVCAEFVKSCDKTDMRNRSLPQHPLPQIAMRIRALVKRVSIMLWSTASFIVGTITTVEINSKEGKELDLQVAIDASDIGGDPTASVLELTAARLYFEQCSNALGCSGEHSSCENKRLCQIADRRRPPAWLDDVGVFFDFYCLPQRPREEDQEKYFKFLLTELSNIIVSTTTFLAWHEPQRIRSRGWCIAEAAIAYGAHTISNVEEIQDTDILNKAIKKGEDMAGQMARRRSSVTDQKPVQNTHSIIEFSSEDLRVDRLVPTRTTTCLVPTGTEVLPYELDLPRELHVVSQFSADEFVEYARLNDIKCTNNSDIRIVAAVVGSAQYQSWTYVLALPIFLNKLYLNLFRLGYAVSYMAAALLFRTLTCGQLNHYERDVIDVAFLPFVVLNPLYYIPAAMLRSLLNAKSRFGMIISHRRQEEARAADKAAKAEDEEKQPLLSQD